MTWIAWLGLRKRQSRWRSTRVSLTYYRVTLFFSVFLARRIHFRQIRRSVPHDIRRKTWASHTREVLLQIFCVRIYLLYSCIVSICLQSSELSHADISVIQLTVVLYVPRTTRSWQDPLLLKDNTMRLGHFRCNCVWIIHETRVHVAWCERWARVNRRRRRYRAAHEFWERWNFLWNLSRFNVQCSCDTCGYREAFKLARGGLGGGGHRKVTVDFHVALLRVIGYCIRSTEFRDTVHVNGTCVRSFTQVSILSLSLSLFPSLYPPLPLPIRSAPRVFRPRCIFPGIDVWRYVSGMRWYA